MTKAAKKLKRIQFEFTVNTIQKLNDFMADFNIRTKMELFNNALSLLMWAVKEVRAGRIIASVDEQTGDYKEVCMPILAQAELLVDDSKITRRPILNLKSKSKPASRKRAVNN